MKQAHRSVRAKAFLGGVTVAACVAAAAWAPAQTRGRPTRPTPRPKATASAEAPGEEKVPAPSASAASATAGAADGGAIVAPEPDQTPAGTRLSPLNPAANEISDASVAPPSIDYDRLLADIAALRARVAVVSDTLFHSRIAISLEARGDHARVASLSVALDDGVVWTAPGTLRAEEPVPIYEHAVAPGHHAVTVEVERRDDREARFRSAQRSRFIVEVPSDQSLAVQIKVTDDSNMGKDFPGDRSGKYDLGVQLRAQAKPVKR